MGLVHGTRSRDGSRDRCPRSWEVIEIPSCGDLHQRSSPTLLMLHRLVSHDLKPCMQSSWMILGSCYVGSKFLFSAAFPNMCPSHHSPNDMTSLSIDYY